MNFDKIFLIVPIFIPDAPTQIMFNGSFKNSFPLSFDSWSMDRKTFDGCKITNPMSDSNRPSLK